MGKKIYRVVRIPKGKGKWRTIYMPLGSYRRELKDLVFELNKLAMQYCDVDVCHGFMPGKSPATNASYHVDYAWTLAFDLQDFFDTVTRDHVRSRISSRTLDQVLIDGAPRQGLPTSPAVSNIAACDMDTSLRAISKDMTYTRYADDLTFSTNNEELLDLLRQRVPVVIAEHGFVLNQRKTKLMAASQGRRMITGLGVDSGVHIPRRLKRRARAATHQGNLLEANGLLRWMCSPHPVCPVCGGDLQHDHSVTMHLRRHTGMWGNYQSVLSVSHFEDNRGGITDWSRLYRYIKDEIAIAALS